MSAWTPAEDSQLRKEWARGLTASVIATSLNQIYGTARSRSAVLGRVHRLNLSARAIPSHPVRMRKKRKRASPKPQTTHNRPETGHQRAESPKPTPPAPKPKKAAPEPSSADTLRLEITELTRNQCRWPVDERTDGTHLFCGLRQAEGASYCAGHLAKSISPLSESTLKRAPVSMKKAMS